MTFSSPRQIYCRCCGKKIAKLTTLWYLKRGSERSQKAQSAWWFDLTLPNDVYPKTKADCQKLMNEQVVSVGYSEYPERHISKFTTWDGLTYVDRHFCTGECAKTWGYIMADKFPDVASNAYRVATAGAKAKDAKA
jgi:hypothetical protein